MKRICLFIVCILAASCLLTSCGNTEKNIARSDSEGLSIEIEYEKVYITKRVFKLNFKITDTAQKFDKILLRISSENFYMGHSGDFAKIDGVYERSYPSPNDVINDFVYLSADTNGLKSGAIKFIVSGEPSGHGIDCNSEICIYYYIDDGYIGFGKTAGAAKSRALDYIDDN